MNKERLLNVARALRESPNPDQFCMDAYFNECGTPACAFGHYAMRSDLQDEFHVVRDDYASFIENSFEEHVTHSSPSVLKHFGFQSYAEADAVFGCHGSVQERRDDGYDGLMVADARTAAEAADLIERIANGE